MHVLKANNKVSVLPYFSILSKFKYMSSVTSLCLMVYNSTSRVCVAIPIHNLIHIFVRSCMWLLLLYIASINDDLKLFHPEQRDLTRIICIIYLH